jgi:Matrixin
VPGRTPTAEQRAKLDELVGNILFRDLRAFVRVLAIEPSRVDVVVLQHIASPDVQSQLAGSGVIAGLGLSPVLFRNIAADDANKDLFAALALPDDFAATLFVGHEDIVRIAQNPEGIVAHEMGHALGLQHTQEPGNLMTQYQANQRCIPGLTADQIAQLRGTAMRVSVSESWERVLGVKRTIVERLISSGR